MKKSLTMILTLALALVLVLTVLTGCGNDKHEFSNAWETDGTSHWHQCTTKDHTDVSEKAEHVYDNDADTTCNVCGYERAAHTHQASTEWSTDGTNHWHLCSVNGCTEKLDVEAHTYDDNADATCNVCGYGRTVTFTITFNSNGGSEVQSIQVEPGDKIAPPTAPTKSGERFVGWYESADGGTTLNDTEFVFGYMPRKDITLYAKWQDAVIGSWETYQVVIPAETESDEDTVIIPGEEFPFLGITLAKDTFNLTVEDTKLTLTLTMGESNTSGSATYTKTDGVYVATLTIMGDTVYTLTTYDDANDRLLCEIRDKEGEGYTTYYKLTLARVNDEA